MHMSLLYETKQDLMDILVPYFKAGLENNEFCMWVTSDLVDKEAAYKAIGASVDGFEQYFRKGQIEIVPYREWYLKAGFFSPIQSIVSWVEKHKWAISQKYEGLRATGDIFWLETQDWRRFMSYENEINKAIRRYHVIALCTYPLSKCNTSSIIDVGINHRLALVKEKGKWKIVKNRVYKRMKERLSWKSSFAFES